MNRRSVLFAMGATSLSAGAIFGSGAFTTIEADRSVELGVSNDSDAQVAFKRGSGTGADRIINKDTDAESIEVIQFNQEKLNRQAKTVFKRAIKIENNTESLSIELYVSKDAETSDSDTLDISDGPLDFRTPDGEETTSGGDGSIVGTENDQSITIGAESSAELDIVVDLRGDDIIDGTTTAEDNLGDISQVTFVVNANENSNET